MKYRVENIAVPETVGIARPDLPSDRSIDLGSRRIIQVLGNAETLSATGEVRLKVLTEQDD
jgi:hypothetical protein